MTARAPGTSWPLRVRHSRPAPPVRSIVESYYLLESAAGANRFLEGLLVPDGHLELSFNLGGGRWDRTGDDWRAHPGACVDDVLLRGRLLRWETPIRFVGVKLQYSAGIAFTGLTPSDIAGAPAELSGLDHPSWNGLRERLDEAESWRSTVGILDAFFTTFVSGSCVDDLVARATDITREAAGSKPIGEVAEAIGVSRRTLELRIKQRTGLSPKRLAQIVRIRTAIRRVCADPDASLGRLAFHLGFFDQSHFIREFKQVACVPPGRFFTEPQFVADLCENTSSPGH